MIRSNRDQGVHFHTTPDVLQAIQQECGTRGVFRSKFIHDVMVAELRRLGHDVKGYEYAIELTT